LVIYRFIEFPNDSKSHKRRFETVVLLEVNMRGLSIMVVFLILSVSMGVVTGESTVEIRGGGSVMFEQATAVWCDVCAQHEAWISPMVESNGERLIRVNLHSSINDPLGNEASKYRRTWLGHSDSDSTPLYHFDGSKELTPSSSRGELQRSLLDAEADRISHEILDVSIAFDSSTVTIEARIDDPIRKNGTQMTLMIMETVASVSPEDATNGILESHSVLQNIATIGVNDSSIFPSDWVSTSIEYETGIIAIFNFQWPSGLNANSSTIVVIHEEQIPNNGRTTLSALSWSIQSSEVQKIQSFWPPLIGIGILIASIVLYSRIKLDTEQ